MQDNLILLRKKMKVSQETLANLIGISAKQFGAKERGETTFNGDEMFLISNFFGKTVEEIFLPTTHQNGELILEE